MRTLDVPVPLALLAVASLSACAHRYSEEAPPSNAKPLSEIVMSIGPVARRSSCMSIR